jgi:CelD/BcsL family acetyltransferase involved in cellulose biosynthesis
MKVERLCTLEELEAIRPVWNQLAGDSPFRQWQWLHSWWQAFSTEGELYVLQVVDSAGQVIGIAPWYLERSLTQGRRIRQLGSGRACSDYQSVLVQPEHESAVAETLADWLLSAGQLPQHRWDELDLEASAEDDSPMSLLADCLRHRDLTVDWRPQLTCWGVPLPDDWDAFVRSRSSSSKRRRLARLKRLYVDTGRAVLRRAETREEVDCFFGKFVELHQRRWAGTSETGCFADSRFTRFLHQAAGHFSAVKQLELTQLYIDGRLAAANCCFVSRDCCSVYQCGMDPAEAEHQPGWLLNVLLLRNLMERGFRYCDYLRGDERYKRDLEAIPRRQRHLRVAAPRSLARLRHQAWVTKDWLRQWRSQFRRWSLESQSRGR